MKGKTSEHLSSPICDDFDSVIRKPSTAGKSKPFIKSPTPEQKKQVDEIMAIIRSNTMKFNDEKLSKALNGKNVILEVVIMECTKNTPENDTVNGKNLF